MVRSNEGPSRKLIDYVTGTESRRPRALLATTFDLNVEFVELDFLASLLRLPSWDDRRGRSRVQLEAELARMDAVSLMMEARRYQGRPRSPRVHIVPAIDPERGVLHAKITLIVDSDALRLVVASANLTTQGYRENREVALCLAVDRKNRSAGPLVRQAVKTMKGSLAPWWNAAAQRTADLAGQLLDEWAIDATTEDEWFVWGGESTPLWQQFLEKWPSNEPVTGLRIVSPFWSEESGTGPLCSLLSKLEESGCSVSGAQVSLLTAATADNKQTWRPTLPASYGTFDFTKLGVDARAVAVEPRVSSDDVERDDILRERPLHAKVVILEGPKTTLAYMGSANFTVPGWGFGARPNVEAGVIIRRQGKHRAALQDLIPPGHGEPVPLDGSASTLATPLVEEDDNSPWPSFIRSAELQREPGHPQRLQLTININIMRTPTKWAASCDGGRVRLDAGGGNAQSPSHSLTLDEQAVRALLQAQCIHVEWPGATEPVAFPINVAFELRETLPFGDANAIPGEDELVAFYQGQVSIHDLFPSSLEEADESSSGAKVEVETGVNTTKILSYQVRNFVEALTGLRGDIEASANTETTLRLALLGPVSPVALAREIHKAVTGGRSPTAGGFQLVEILRCLFGTREFRVQSKLADAWQRAHGQATDEIGALLDDLRTAHPALLGGRTSFGKYSKEVLAGADGSRAR